MCLNRLDICVLHNQVIRDKVEVAKNHDSKVVVLWKKSSTCQWFRLLTVCCQRFTHQPIVFLRCEGNAYCIGSAGSLSFFFSSCRPRFSHLAALPLDALSRTWLTEEKRRDCSQSSAGARFSSRHENSFRCHVNGVWLFVSYPLKFHQFYGTVRLAPQQTRLYVNTVQLFISPRKESRAVIM